MYTDNSWEFGKAFEDLSRNHCTSTPHRSETQGIAERAVRRIKEGTSGVFVAIRSGWKLVGRFHGMLLLSAKRSRSLVWWQDPYERRFGKPFNGPIIPFGSLLEYYPISAIDQSRVHQFGKKVCLGLFLGCALYAGGRIWKGDTLVADIEELETMDASEIYSKRLNAKEVIFPKDERKFYFPVADGRITLSGRDQELRTSTLIRERPIRGESHVDFLGESEESLSPLHDSFPDAGWSDEWILVHVRKLHIPPSRWTKSQTSLAERRIIPCSRTTHTNLDVMRECRIDDYWNVDGSRDLSDSWTGFTQLILLEEKPPDGKMWSGRRLTRKQLTSRPDHLCPELWTKLCRIAQLMERQKCHMKNQNSIMLENYEEFISLTLRTRNSKKPSRMLARNWKHQWLPLCLARQARTVSMVRPVVNQMRSNQNLRVFWKPVNPQDCVWENLYRIIMKTILQAQAQTILLRCLTIDFRALMSVDGCCST